MFPCCQSRRVVTPQEAVETAAAQQPDLPVVVITPSKGAPLPGGGIQEGGEVTGPPETGKSGEPPVKFEPLPISEVPKVLDSIVASAKEFPNSFNPRVGQERFEGSKISIEAWVEKIKDALENGDTKTARDLLNRELRSGVVNFGDPLQSKFVPKELKEQHDPKDKYIQKDRVDPRVLNIYIQIIDILVATDKSY